MAGPDVDFDYWPSVDGHPSAGFFFLSLVVVLPNGVKPASLVPLVGRRIIALVEHPSEPPVSGAPDLVIGEKAVNVIHRLPYPASLRTVGVSSGLAFLLQ